LQVKVRYSDFTTLTRQVRVSEPVVEAAELYRLACHLLSVHRLVSGPLRLLGLGVSNLVAPEQPQLLLPF
jgi:DNA polymerase-4